MSLTEYLFRYKSFNLGRTLSYFLQSAFFLFDFFPLFFFPQCIVFKSIVQFIYFIFDIHILGFSLDGRLGCAYLSGFLLKTLCLLLFLPPLLLSHWTPYWLQ